uniref:Aminopeptidase N n=1 Tax=Anopheles quadriannulatus TaxID=34691 RepID=A0A182XHW8_ANOQN
MGWPQERKSAKSLFVQLFLQFFLLLSVLTNSAAQDEQLNYRLPNNTYPLRYNIELTTRIHDSTIGDDRFRFEGKVTIQLKTAGDADTDNVTLNYRRINITRVKLWYNDQDGWENILLDDELSFTLDSTREFLTVHSPKPLNGTYFLEIKYNGTLREDNGGFYRSSYSDSDGNVQWLATTQFSPTDARHVFPCYDEPGIRAPIALRVIHGKSYSVLSNTIPIDVRESILAGMSITTFPDTPKMPSYLLGIIVSDFKEVSLPNFTAQSAFIRATALTTPVANFILEAGFKILQYLEEFLETPYILPKLYHVAIPDFSPGAMENYGLITYKEENFMFDPDTSPMKQKKKIASIVGHEIGHHYFGNYVSPAWWSYLWMKEGFARFFEYTAAQIAFPELTIGKMYTVDKTHNVFQLDALGSTRPMTFYVNSQVEISNIFDDIAYDKGGAVLLMLYHAFGKEPFRQAMVNFLHVNALQAGTPEKFAQSMQQTMFSSIPPTDPPFNALSLLKSWTEQAGYPILYVSRSDDNCLLRIEQERFLLKSTDASNATSTWIIPYNFATETQPNFDDTTATGWIVDKYHVINPTADHSWTCDSWIVFNKQQTGYYRVNYDDQLWLLIVKALVQNGTIIHESNRAQLIDDALNIARAGKLAYAIPLQLLRYLSKENDYLPWAALDRNLVVLDNLMRGTDSYDDWHKYCSEFIEPSYIEMGMATQPQDTLTQRMTREIVINWACKVGSEACINSTRLMVAEIAETPAKDAEPDLREAIYCNGLRYSAATVFDSIWRKMQQSQDQLYRSELIRSLGCAENAELITKYLQSTIDTDNSTYFNQERERVFIAVFKNSLLGLEMAMNFLRENSDRVNELYNKGNFGGRAINSIIRTMAQQITSEAMQTKFQTLTAELHEKGFLRESDMLQALEYSSENLKWIEEKSVQITAWLDEQYRPTTTALPSTTVTTNQTPPPVTTTSTVASPSSTTVTTYSYVSTPSNATVTTTSTVYTFSTSENVTTSSTVFVNLTTTSMPEADNLHSNHAARANMCDCCLMLLGVFALVAYHRFETLVL